MSRRAFPRAQCSRRPEGRRFFFAFVWLSLQLASPAWSQTEEGIDRDDVGVALDTVVVSAPSEAGSLRTAPHSVTVFTRARIEQSAAGDLGALLSEAANVQFRSFYGGDKRGSVDIRGMGDTAGSNVLILVNGQRLNEIDLSGADLASVPIDQIERIEIVRGGGGVRYGDGAVGGVVNIITREAGSAERFGARVGLAAGSYARREALAEVYGRAGDLFVRAETRDVDTDGYRENNGYAGHDRAIELRFVPERLSVLDLGLRAAVHRDRYGMPGPVSRRDFLAGEAARRAASPSGGEGETEDRSLRLRAELDLESAGRLELSWFGRSRHNPYTLASTPGLIESRQREFNARYSVTLGPQTLTLGTQRLWGDYQRFDGEDGVLGTKRKLGTLKRRAWYLEEVLRLPGRATLTLGYRKGLTESRQQNQLYARSCVTFFPPTGCVNSYEADPDPNAAFDQRNTWHHRAQEIGLSWRPTDAITIFLSQSRHYRGPNLDELALADPDLKPQHGVTLEQGLRVTPGGGVTLSLTAFNMRNTDEIYYGRNELGLSVNRNHEWRTRRLGYELEADWIASPQWRFNLAAGYVRPRFEGADADIPHVARKTATLRVTWTPSSAWSTTATLRHVGGRFDGNDTTNAEYVPLPAYNVVDLATRYRTGSVSLSVTVSNLFNKVYSTQAYSETYYPMPDRHVLFEAGVGF